MYNATLKLSDGTSVRGVGRGHTADTKEFELVFNTSVVGYMETLTDPASRDHIVVQTFPSIGNYGVAHDDIESEETTVAGLVVRHLNDTPSNFRSQSSLDGFLQSKGIPCIEGVDTRALTHKIRDSAKLTARIVFDKPTTVAPAKKLIAHLDRYTVGDKGPRVAVIDLGIKRSTKDLLINHAVLEVFSKDAGYNEIMAISPQAIVFSDGGGSPNSHKLAIQIAKANVLTRRPLPMLGLGLGHHILALAHGLKLGRLNIGHRGNQAIRHLATGRIYQTANNSGMTVLPKGVDGKTIRVMYQNVNDQSIEGLYYKTTKSLGVQFLPNNIRTVAGTGFVLDEFFAQLQ